MKWYLWLLLIAVLFNVFDYVRYRVSGRSGYYRLHSSDFVPLWWALAAFACAVALIVYGIEHDLITF